MLEWVKQHGYTVGGMLDNDIVGSDSAAAGRTACACFRSGDADDNDAPSAKWPAPLRNPWPFGGALDFQYRPPRPRRRSLRLLQGGTSRRSLHGTAGGLSPPTPDSAHGKRRRVRRSDEVSEFYVHGQRGTDNAEALRQLALAPAPPRDIKLGGGISPDAKLTWSADDDANRAGFEILWRETTDPRWQVYDFVAAGTEYVLKASRRTITFWQFARWGRMARVPLRFLQIRGKGLRRARQQIFSRGFRSINFSLCAF